MGAVAQRRQLAFFSYFPLIVKASQRAASALSSPHWDQLLLVRR